MKSSTRDKIEGAAHEAKGKAKGAAGKVFGNPNLQTQGTAEKVAGKVQCKVGDVKKVFGK
ncbi:MAG: CsbD family protein [Chthoniobacteraceae bacterium]